MARSLHDQYRGLTLISFTSLTSGTTAFFVVVTVLAICSIVSFLCTTHGRFKSNNNMGRRGGSARKLTASVSDIGRRAYVKMGKMISWKREVEVVELEEEEAVWKKRILKGERCRPLDFCGRIVYDAEGKQVVMLESPEKTTTTRSS